MFDLGGGTFDVSILKMKGTVLTVLAMNGDSNLGGEDIDNNLIEHFLKEMGLTSNIDDHLHQELKNECLKLKQTLSKSDCANIFIEKKKFEMTRAKFDDLNYELFEEMLKITKRILAEKNLKKDEIDEILLVGGSTRIKALQKMLQTFFGQTLNHTVSADEAVALGAAIQAHIKFSDPELLNPKKAIKLFDVCPYTISTDIANGKVDFVIPKNSPIPIEVTKKYKPVSHNQTSIIVAVFEGESEYQIENRKLGQFTYGLSYSYWSTRYINCKFSMDENGVLSVTGRAGKGNKNELLEDKKTNTTFYHKDFEIEIDLRMKYMKETKANDVDIDVQSLISESEPDILQDEDQKRKQLLIL